MISRKPFLLKSETPSHMEETTLNVKFSVTYYLDLHILIYFFYDCNFMPSKDVNAL